MEATLIRLQTAIQALAQPAWVQMQLFQPAVVADELAVDFDRWRVAAMSEYSLDHPQVKALDDLDAALESMQGPGAPDLWTAEALQESPEWDRVRELAREALRAFGWRFAGEMTSVSFDTAAVHP